MSAARPVRATAADESLERMVMVQPGADQHQGRVAIGERPHHAGPAADLTIQPLDHVVGTDACPVLTGKIAVGQSFLDAVLNLLGSLLQLHCSQLGNNGFCFLAGRFLLSWAWIALSIFATILTLDLGTTEKTLR